jgi:hypothetical protein
VIITERTELNRGIKKIPSMTPPAPTKILPVSELGFKKSVNIVLKIVAE